MTGTPVQNRLEELYSLLQLVDRKKFPAKHLQEFVSKYHDPKDPQGSQLPSSIYKLRVLVTDEFRALFREYCLRRTKDIVQQDLPQLSEVKLYHGMSALQKDLYKAILSDNRGVSQLCLFRLGPVVCICVCV